MGKTRDLIDEIRDIERRFHARMGTIKDRNAKDITETEEIKRRQQEYTAELYQKGVNDPENHGGVVTHLEPDIPESEVKWALGSITTNKARGEWFQDGRRVGGGDHFLPDRYIKRSPACGATTTEQFLNAGTGPQIPISLKLRGTKDKDEKGDEGFQDGDLSWGGIREVSTQQEAVSVGRSVRALESQRQHKKITTEILPKGSQEAAPMLATPQ